MTTLCFDFGNTRLKAAFFREDVMAEEIYLPDDQASTIESTISAVQTR
jgi:type III pantothenate kinase